jgi:hypothetical protein
MNFDHWFDRRLGDEVAPPAGAVVVRKGASRCEWCGESPPQSVQQVWRGGLPQSRQSARLFLQSSELGLPHPLTRKQVRGWGSPSSDEGTYTVVLYIYARKQGQETRKQGREVRN